MPPLTNSKLIYQLTRKKWRARLRLCLLHVQKCFWLLACHSSAPLLLTIAALRAILAAISGFVMTLDQILAMGNRRVHRAYILKHRILPKSQNAHREIRLQTTLLKMNEAVLRHLRQNN